MVAVAVIRMAVAQVSFMADIAVAQFLSIVTPESVTPVPPSGRGGAVRKSGGGERDPAGQAAGAVGICFLDTLSPCPLRPVFPPLIAVG